MDETRWKALETRSSCALLSSSGALRWDESIHQKRDSADGMGRDGDGDGGLGAGVGTRHFFSSRRVIVVGTLGTRGTREPLMHDHLLYLSLLASTPGDDPSAGCL